MVKRIIFDLDDTLFITDKKMFVFLIKILIKYKNILSIKKIKAIIKSFKKYENKYEMYDKKTFIDFFSNFRPAKSDTATMRLWRSEKSHFSWTTLLPGNKFDKNSNFYLKQISKILGDQSCRKGVC